MKEVNILFKIENKNDRLEFLKMLRCNDAYQALFDISTEIFCANHKDVESLAKRINEIIFEENRIDFDDLV